MRHAPSRFPTPGREVLGDNPPRFASEDDAREEARLRLCEDWSEYQPCEASGCRERYPVADECGISYECAVDGFNDPPKCDYWDTLLDEIVEGLL